jgi:L-seryl-tRNA(Ser) seleniumtransferase
MSKSDDNNQLLRALPSIDALLKTETARRLADDIGAAKLASLARLATENLRQELIAGSPGHTLEENGNSTDRGAFLKQAEAQLLRLHEMQIASGVRPVINATGVIVHTNLGRAPLSQAARDAILEASGYCTLEYDTLTGTRGRRGARAEQLLTDLTGAEAALIVNNCAAAALLVLNTFSRAGETIVSRGELVEIGGDFRVPDVMAQSGVNMIEVGTTNRTRLSDYRNAINENTRMIMRVHTSNYRIVGFTKTPSLSELADLSHTEGLLLYEDAGSGALIDFNQFGIDGEPVIKQSLRDGADLVSFSGDKLLGGPQTGLIVGRTELINQMRRSPLYRALRADKLRLAALAATLESYSRGVNPPTVEMIAMPPEQIEKRAKKLLRRIYRETPETLTIEPIATTSAVGGGSAPTSSLPTTALAIACKGLTADQIADKLRQWNPPIISRIVDDRVLIDLRTVALSEEAQLEKALFALAEHSGS